MKSIGYCHSMWACFLWLHDLHNIWIFWIVDEPPFATGIMWSYCSSKSEPHFTHFPPSLFYTAFLTSVGIGKRRLLPWYFLISICQTIVYLFLDKVVNELNKFIIPGIFLCRYCFTDQLHYHAKHFFPDFSGICILLLGGWYSPRFGYRRLHSGNRECQGFRWWPAPNTVYANLEPLPLRALITLAVCGWWCKEITRAVPFSHQWDQVRYISVSTRNWPSLRNNILSSRVKILLGQLSG